MAAMPPSTARCSTSATGTNPFATVGGASALIVAPNPPLLPPLLPPPPPPPPPLVPLAGLPPPAAAPVAPEVPIIPEAQSGVLLALGVGLLGLRTLWRRRPRG